MAPPRWGWGRRLLLLLLLMMNGVFSLRGLAIGGRGGVKVGVVERDDLDGVLGIGTG